MKSPLFLMFFFSFSMLSMAQIEYKKYPKSLINNSENEIAPTLSMDGNTILFMRKRAMEADWYAQIAKKTNGEWLRSTDLMVLNELPKLRLLGSYALNGNGSEILFTSKKSGGLGSYDIWSIQSTGATWANPENLGNPLNTKLDEVSPCFTTDNNSIFFVRKNSSESNGKVYFSTRKNNFWSTPKEVSLHNTFACVRIAADNETMYLSKIVEGKTQLFISQNKAGTWSNPTQIKDFDGNSSPYFGVDVQSNLLTISCKKEESYDLYFCKLKPEYSAKSISVLNYTNETAAKILIKDKESGTEIYKGLELKNYYLKNEKAYILSFIYKEYYPYVLQVNLANAPSSNKNISPKLISIKNPFLIKDFDSSYSFVASDFKDFFEALKVTTESNPDKKFKIVCFEADATANDKTDELLRHMKAAGLKSMLPHNVLFEKEFIQSALSTRKRGVYVVCE